MKIRQKVSLSPQREASPDLLFVLNNFMGSTVARFCSHAYEMNVFCVALMF